MSNRSFERILAVALGLWMTAAGHLVAQGDQKGGGEEEEKPFTIDQVIHPLVAKLPAPKFYEEIIAIPMAISSKSPIAQKHVAQGMALIQAAWDFEAYRHFCEAVKADPNCMMAYWGIGLALAAPNNEFAKERMVAVTRMLDLSDATVTVGGEERRLVTPMEEEYAIALGVLFSSQGRESGKAFKTLSERYPNNLQAKCMAIYLQRDGYNEIGQPLYGQERAIEKMKEVLNDYPENLGVMSFWAMLHAEAPEATTVLRDEILPMVRGMVERVPNFPPYQHLLGHYEWRCGNHRLAEEAFRKASALYVAYMKENDLTFHECDGWVRCRLYLATALHSRGKYKEALAVAADIAGLKVEEKRLSSTGANLVLWEGRTLPARLYAARGWQGDLDRAIDSLPGKDDPQLFAKKTLSIFYLESLRQYLGGRKELGQGDRDKGLQFREAMSMTGQLLLEAQGQAMHTSSVSEYLRALRALEVYTAEFRGLLALGSQDAVDRKVAFNWFRSAADKQQRPTLLMPPAVIYPMELRLAEYYSRSGNHLKAAELCQEALQRRPNDLSALKLLRDELISLGRKEDADQIGAQIELVSEH